MYYNTTEILEFFEDNKLSNTYGIIFGEGDTWGIKEIPLSPKEMLDLLELRKNVYKGECVISYIGDLGTKINLICHSIMFPDGRIWDGRLGRFRDEPNKIQF